MEPLDPNNPYLHIIEMRKDISHIKGALDEHIEVARQERATQNNRIHKLEKFKYWATGIGATVVFAINHIFKS